MRSDCPYPDKQHFPDFWVAQRQRQRIRQETGRNLKIYCCCCGAYHLASRRPRYSLPAEQVGKARYRNTPTRRAA